MHHIYPEGEGNLARVAGERGHELFKAYGAKVPDEDWNDPGTKQGLYMMGPNGEYLNGGGAISGSPRRVRRRLEKALERWGTLRREKGYGNDPVPRSSNVAVPEIADKALVMRVFLRDLPRGEGDDSGRRFEPRDLRGRWMDFTQWAWNTNWWGTDDPMALVPEGEGIEAVASTVFRRLCREVLVDNVRGQNPRWRDQHVKLAALTMKRLKDHKGQWVIEYRGRASMEDGDRKYAPVLYGRGVWDPKRKEFVSLDIVAAGDRAGAARFNQRGSDRGAAPMGIALVLFSR